MELRQLEYFIAVAEELHFGKAALRLQMTQPPLSQQIQHLEQEMGVTLFHRTKRHVELTRAGQAFLQETKVAVKKIYEAVETARRTERGQIGKLTVGFVGSATYDLLPKVVRLYRERFPEVEIILRELATPQQVESLQSGGIDVGVLRPPISDRTLTVEVVQREQCFIVLPTNHPLATSQSISLQELDSESYVIVPRSTWPGFHDALMGLCHQMGFSPLIRQEATELQTVIGLVAAGIGIAVVPASAENLHVRGVVYRQLNGAAPTVEMAIAWRKNDTSAFIKGFTEAVRASVKGS